MTGAPDLVAMYARLNADYFDGALPAAGGEDDRVLVSFGIPYESVFESAAEMGCYGLTHSGDYPFELRQEAYFDVHLHSVLLDPPEWVSMTVEDVVLHEMAHVAVTLRWSKRLAGHHDARFAAECNRIGRRHGWDDVVVSGGWEDDEWNVSEFWPDNVNEAGA